MFYNPEHSRGWIEGAIGKELPGQCPLCGIDEASRTGKKHKM
jgi:hypothetical protein